MKKNLVTVLHCANLFMFFFSLLWPAISTQVPSIGAYCENPAEP